LNETNFTANTDFEYDASSSDKGPAKSGSRSGASAAAAPAVVAVGLAAAAAASETSGKEATNEASPSGGQQRETRAWAAIVAGGKKSVGSVSPNGSAASPIKGTDAEHQPTSSTEASKDAAAPEADGASDVVDVEGDGAEGRPRERMRISWSADGEEGGDERGQSHKASKSAAAGVGLGAAGWDANVDEDAITAALWNRFPTPEEALMATAAAANLEQQGGLWHPQRIMDQDMTDAYNQSMAPMSPMTMSQSFWVMPPMTAPNGKPATTVSVDGIPPDLDADGLTALMEVWGLTGTYDFIYTPMEKKGKANQGYALVNFIDAAFVNLFSWIVHQSNFQGAVTWADVQGFDNAQQLWVKSCLEGATRYTVTAEVGVQGLGFRPSALPPERMYIDSVEPDSWSACVGVGLGDEMVMVNDMHVENMTQEDLMKSKTERPLLLTFMRHEVTSKPVVDANPVPSQWAVNSVNTMLSERFNAQFYKTKPCMFFSQNRCERGANCPFAHSEAELMPVPNLTKTKLCYNFFRNRCSTRNCKFAHGSRELRSAWDGINGTGMGGFGNQWGFGFGEAMVAANTNAPGTWMEVDARDPKAGECMLPASSSESEASPPPAPTGFLGLSSRKKSDAVFSAEDLRAHEAAREAAGMLSSMAGIVHCTLGQVALVEETLKRLTAEKRQKRRERHERQESASSSGAAAASSSVLDDGASDSEGAESGLTLRRSWTDGDLAAIGNALEAQIWA